MPSVGKRDKANVCAEFPVHVAREPPYAVLFFDWKLMGKHRKMSCPTVQKACLLGRFEAQIIMRRKYVGFLNMVEEMNHEVLAAYRMKLR